MNLTTRPSTKGNGLARVSEKAEEFKFGKMEANTKATGRTIRQTVTEDSYTLTATASTESG
jgi:hypothetical protein